MCHANLAIFFLYLSYELQNNNLEEGERKFIFFDNNPYMQVKTFSNLKNTDNLRNLKSINVSKDILYLNKRFKIDIQICLR